MSKQLLTGELRAAEAQRYQTLVLLSQGQIDLAAFLTMAATARGKYLRRITLARLIGTAFDWPPHTSKDAVARIVALSGAKTQVSPGRLTVAWLLDPRTAGRRLQCFFDVLTPLSDLPPWPGWPYRLRPEEACHDAE